MSEQPVVFLEAAVPILTVTDLSEAIAYYTKVLGFQVGWQAGEPPHLASVCRNRVEVNLSQSRPMASSGASRTYFQVTGVDAYYTQVTAAGARVTVPLADRAYGMRDFRIVDPDGNELSFGEGIEQTPSPTP